MTTPTDKELSPRIAVFGVGGGGVNAVNNMISANLEGVDFFVANTDAQALENSLASNKIKFGINSTKGLGAGSDPKIGEIAAEESSNEIIEALEKYNLIFITAGMGGGTGTGGCPIIAKLAKERNILTVGVVTKPFHFEGARRMKVAEEGLDSLQKFVDTLIIIPNQNLFRLANEKTTLADAFKMADEVLHAGVKSITDLITKPGIINLDFADINSVMNEKGKAMMGTGQSEGENRAIKASEAAISNPLLDHSSMKGAKGVLINITGGVDMTLFEVDEAANKIKEEVDTNANIIFGSAFDNNLEGSIRVSVVATGIDTKTQRVSNNINNGLDNVNINEQNIIEKSNSRGSVNKHENLIDNRFVENDILGNKKQVYSTEEYKTMLLKECYKNNIPNHPEINKNSYSNNSASNLEKDSFYYSSTDSNNDYEDKKCHKREKNRSTIENSEDINLTRNIFEIPTFLRNKKK